jgi:hypothetical protein
MTFGVLASPGAPKGTSRGPWQAAVDRHGSPGPLVADKKAIRASSEAARESDKTPRHATSQYRGEGWCT